jgi:hypothetical protein
MLGRERGLPPGQGIDKLIEMLAALPDTDRTPNDKVCVFCIENVLGCCWRLSGARRVRVSR